MVQYLHQEKEKGLSISNQHKTLTFTDLNESWLLDWDITPSEFQPCMLYGFRVRTRQLFAKSFCLPTTASTTTTSSTINVMTYNLHHLYCMVGNFCEGFIFVFFASQEPFAKIKTAKFCCPRTMQANRVSIWPTLNYLFELQQKPVSECAFDGYRSSHSGNWSATSA